MTTDHDRYLRVIDLLLQLRATYPTVSAFENVLEQISTIFNFESVKWQPSSFEESVVFPSLTGEIGNLVVTPASALDIDSRILIDRIAQAWVMLIEQVRAEQLHDARHDRHREQLSYSLQEARTRSEILFSHNPQPMWIFDSETLRFLAVNEAALTQYGYNRDEFFGMTVAELRPPEDTELFYRTLKTVGPVQQGRFRHLRKNGQVIHVFVQSHAITYEGRNARIVAVSDISSLMLNQLEVLKDLPSEKDLERTTNAPPVNPHKDHLRGCSILVVEDSRDNQFLLGHILSGAGARVDLATNGAEGLTKALQNSYDLVIMDLQMPIMDGYTAMGKLALAGFCKPVIALTANAFRHDQIRCAEAGFCDFVTKPINPGLLIERIKFHLSQGLPLRRPECFEQEPRVLE